MSKIVKKSGSKKISEMRLKNIHPGEILLEEFLKPMDISQNALSVKIQVPPRRINEIVLEKRAITADTDLRLSKFFGTSEGYWLSLQSHYDLEEKKLEIGVALKQIQHFKKKLIERSREPYKAIKLIKKKIMRKGKS